MAKQHYFRINSNQGKAASGQPKADRPPITASNTAKQSAAVSKADDAQKLKMAYVFYYRFAQGVQQGYGELSSYRPSKDFDRRGTWRVAAESLRHQGLDPVRYIRVLFGALMSSIIFPKEGVSETRARRKMAAKAIANELQKRKEEELAQQLVFVDQDDWNDHHPPTPAQITNAKYIKLYRETIEKGKASAVADRTTSIDWVRGRCGFFQRRHGVNANEALAIVLADEDRNYTSCFAVYCIAMSAIQEPATTTQVKDSNNRLRDIAMDVKGNACMEYLKNEEGCKHAWGRWFPVHMERDAEDLYARLIANMDPL